MTTAQDIDPFAGADKSPSLSFKDVGTVYTGVVTEGPKLVQSRDFESGEPAFWPAKPGETPNPKMSVVINLEVDGEERSLWAPKPSAMFAALAAAQKDAGARIATGGTLSIKYTGDKPNEKNPRLNPQKLYAARYAAPDPFGDAPQAAAPAKSAGGWDETPPF